MSLIVPGIAGAVITGIGMALKTHWGLIKHNWLIAKEIVVTAIVAIGSSLNIWVHDSIRITSEKGLGALQDPAYVQDRGVLIVCAVIQTFLFVFIIAISVLKPWGKRKSHRLTGQ